MRSGSDNAYGIYLTQMLFISWLSWHGWAHLDRVVPWPLVVLLTVPIVFVCGIALTSLLARTPLAVPLTGRPQQPWSTLIPPRWRAAEARPAPADGPGRGLTGPLPGPGGARCPGRWRA